MDIESILKYVAALNNNIKISLVKSSSQLNTKGTELAKLINIGKMIYDSIRGTEKPDVFWVKAILELKNIKENQGQDILDFYLNDLAEGTKPSKFEQFMIEWERFSGSSKENSKYKSASNIDNLLKAAAYFDKFADNAGAKARIAKLIDSHVQHIVGLINRGDVSKAKEYIDVIRPDGWENNTERNIDKIYEEIVRELAENLEPEAFQALGL
jgi:hypothetical protein